MITKIINFCKGKKTYAIAIVMVILGLLNEDKTTILEGLAFLFLRSGLKNNK